MKICLQLQEILKTTCYKLINTKLANYQWHRKKNMSNMLLLKAIHNVSSDK